MAKKVIKSKETQYFDENGVLREQTLNKEVSDVTKEDSFYMTFINYVGWKFGLKSDTTKNVLEKLLNAAEFNTGIVILGTDQRAEIVDSLHISKSTLSQSIAQLIKLEVISPVKKIDIKTGEEVDSKNTYLINPQMFWKGELKKRKELIVTFTTRDNSDIEPNTEFDQK